MTSQPPYHRLYSEVEEYTGQHRAPEPYQERSYVEPAQPAEPYQSRYATPPPRPATAAPRTPAPAPAWPGSAPLTYQPEPYQPEPYYPEPQPYRPAQEYSTDPYGTRYRAAEWRAPVEYVPVQQAPVRPVVAERVVRPVTRVPGPMGGGEYVRPVPNPGYAEPMSGGELVGPVQYQGYDHPPALPVPVPAAQPVPVQVEYPVPMDPPVHTRRSGPPPQWSPNASTGRILIVGSGPAGLAAAEEARRLGFAGRITIMGDEPTGPYDRPACSKGLLNGHQTPRDALLAVPVGLDLDWQLGRKAVHLDPRGRRVTAHTGESYDYDGLVIATGARPAVPKGWPAGAPGLHVLHTLHDSWSLRRDLREARRVAIVGGGLTGCEVACAVRGMARQAIIIDPRNCLMNRAIGEAAGLLVTEEHRAAVIELRLGRRVKSVRRGTEWELLLDDGTFVHADVVVVANGGRPDVDWLAGTGIDTSNGVLCDASLRVEGVAGVVAAGVIARWPNLWTGGPPDRVGQWIAALEQGRGAMRTLLAGRRAMPAVTLIPRFWSHQNDLRIQVCGAPDADADLHMVGKGSRRPAARSGMLASYYKGGHLIGLVAVNAAPAFTAAARGMLAAESAAEWHPAGPPDRTLSGAVAVAEMAG